MGTLFAEAPSTPLGAMVIPGTHDSGAYNIDVTEPCEVQAISAMKFKDLVKTPCVAGTLLRAQNRSLGQQLRDGIRYLDLRVGVPIDKVVSAKRAKKPPARPFNVPLVLHHELVSVRLTSGIRQIAEFVGEHPKEQVILDFQHFDLPTDSVIRKYYVRALTKMLRKYDPSETSKPICATSWSRTAFPAPDDRLAYSVGIGDAWDKGKNLVVLVNDGVLPDRACFRGRGEAIKSPWPQTDLPETNITKNATELGLRESTAPIATCTTSPSAGCNFFVSQMQLTPSLNKYFSCPTAPGPQCSLKHYSSLVNPTMAAQIDTWMVDLPVNIFIADFYEDPQSLVSDTVMLNVRRLPTTP